MKNIFFALVFASFGFEAFALPLAPTKSLDTQITRNASYDFEGIVKLSNCSGALIKFAGQPDSSPAYVLTNGHCLGGGFLEPGEAVVDQRVNRAMRIADKNHKYKKVTATKVAYGTMTGTDAAIYELKETYAEIRSKYGIEALDFDPVRPFEGLEIEIISGYWDRGYSCFIDGFVYELHEAKWIWNDSIRYSKPGCETIGGTSGSPIIAKGTRTVIGVNNTGSESGRKCEMNNPCEVTEGGEITANRGTSYGQQTYQFYNCLTADFRIDPSLENCTLTK